MVCVCIIQIDAAFCLPAWENTRPLSAHVNACTCVSVCACVCVLARMYFVVFVVIESEPDLKKSITESDEEWESTEGSQNTCTDAHIYTQARAHIHTEQSPRRLQ